MQHLARLVSSTKALVIFISETRNSSISETTIKNRFNVDAVHVVPAQGQSGGLWLLVKNDVDVDVSAVSRNFFIALCMHKQTSRKFGLVCVYGDPHHQRTVSIWSQV